MLSNDLYFLGTAYYPDYLPSRSRVPEGNGAEAFLSPEEMIERDVSRMTKCGVNVVRMGEFSWSFVERKRDHLDFSRFLFALDRLHEAGIKVVFCTPTATPPKWLIDQFPDILPVQRNGQRIPFGSRRHYDPSHPAYRQESERITEIYAKAFGQHPAVFAWQIDNEFGCHGSAFQFSDHALREFRGWLSERYESIDALNEAWFGSFWSQLYSSYSQIEMPFDSWADQNPHLELDFRRFWNVQWRRFQKSQIDILQKLSPGRSITHNFMTLFTDLCPWEMSKDLDFPGFDHYQMEENPHPVSSAWQFGLMRSLKSNRKFTILEQQPLQVNWQRVNRRYSYDWLFLWTMQSAFQGCNGMLYFSWRRFSGGAEQHHDGIVPHDIRVRESWQEKMLRLTHKFFSILGREFEIKELPAPKRDILCIYNSESIWSHEICAQSENYSTRNVIDFIQSFSHTQGFALDFAPNVEAAGTNLSAYACIVLPGYAFEITVAERLLLIAYLRQGGRILSLPRTGQKSKNNQMSPEPFAFYEGDDFVFEDAGALLANEKERFVPEDSFTPFTGSLWAEKINPAKSAWRSRAQFIDGIFRFSPAILKREFPGLHIHLSICPETTLPFMSWLLNEMNLYPMAVSASLDLQIFPMELSGRSFIGCINFGEDSSICVRKKGDFRMISAGVDEWTDLKPGMYANLMHSDGNATIPVPARQAMLLEFF